MKFKNKFSFLVISSNFGKNQILDVSDLNAAWISEEGVVQARSQVKNRDMQQDGK